MIKLFYEKYFISKQMESEWLWIFVSLVYRLNYSVALLHLTESRNYYFTNSIFAKGAN